MTFFDQLFFNCFNHHKNGIYKRKANNIAVVYITIVQASCLLVLGVFLAKFFQQMHVATMSSTNAWVLFIIAVLILYFKNWIQYNGKKRKIMNANQKAKSNYGIFTLWSIPVGTLILAILFLKVI